MKWTVTETLFADLALTLRSWRQNPGFAITAVLSLALGIAATTTIFSVIYGVIIHPFPYAHPETLMSILVDEPAHNLVFSPYMPDQYLEIAERSKVFDGLLASTISDVVLTGNGNPERLRGNFVTLDTFRVMGVRPLLGRYLTPGDGKTDAAPVAVLGYKFWQKRFGGERNVIGQEVHLNGKVRTIVGVMPPRFMWRGADVYLPIVLQRGKIVEEVRYVNVIGRLKAGVTSAQAEGDLHPIIQDLLGRDPYYHGEAFHVRLRNFYETYPSSIRQQLWILLSAVTLLLLIACVNVSNLLLAKAVARSREIAIRASLGASRFRIGRQLMTESIALGLLAAAVGILLTFGMLQAVKAIIPPNTIPDEADVTINITVLLFASGLSMLTAVLFGLVPAFGGTRINLTEALRRSGRGFAGSSHAGRFRKLLVAGEVALATLLLIGASLVLRTLIKLQDRHLGFEPSSVLSLQVPLSETRYRTIESRDRVIADLIRQIRSLGPIQQIGLNTFVHPFANWGMHVEVPGHAVAQGKIAIFSQINASYPAVIHLPLRAGRFFDDHEVAQGRHLALINETLARTYFATASPIGHAVRLPDLRDGPIKLADDTFTIVGVVADIANVGLERQLFPEVYVPYTTTGFLESFIHPTFLFTAATAPQELASAITARIHAVDRDLPVMEVKTVETLLNEEGFAGPRFSVFLFSVFAALGLTICLIGIYGVVNYFVSNQLPALGVRLALGAHRNDILRLVFGEGAKLILSGVVVGVIGAAAMAKSISSLIWHVSPYDPWSFGIVIVVLVSAGLMACLRPAWRASHVDPMRVLRHE